MINTMTLNDFCNTYGYKNGDLEINKTEPVLIYFSDDDECPYLGLQFIDENNIAKFGVIGYRKQCFCSLDEMIQYLNTK